MPTERTSKDHNTETFNPPPDSQVRQVIYNHTDQTISVRFRRSGKVYVHQKVDPEVFNSWKQWTKAGYSAGQFYHSHIKRYQLAGDAHFGQGQTHPPDSAVTPKPMFSRARITRLRD